MGYRDRRAGAWAGGGGVAGLVAILLAVTATACSSGASSVHLPPKASQASAPSSASSSPPAPPSRQDAVAAYRAIWTAGDRAERSGRAAWARAILAAYATPSYIRFMVSAMAPYWHRREAARGYMTDHILTATVVTGSGGHYAAIIVDCQDASHHELARARTDRLIPGSQGPRRAKLYASLTYANGRWLVDHITFAGSRC